MQEKKKTVRISVRNLVEFLLRSGDLTAGAGRIPDQEAMLAGSRIHRKIQGRRGGAYRAEVSLKERVDFGTFDLVVEGRADGIDADTKGSVIEEIKGIYADVSKLESPVPVHLAQAKCYACIYAKQEHLETIRIRMTYCSLETEEIRSFTSSHRTEELTKWFDDLCQAYRKWAAFQIAWGELRSESIRDLEFPFVYRVGQRDMVAAVYHTIKKGKQLFVQAPTGVGKTMSAVFPAVRALQEGSGERIFYLTAKTIARTVAEEAFRILQENGLRCKTVTLTAKEKLCICDEMICDPAHCPRAKGHYDRINDALYAFLTEGTDYSRSEVLAWSGQYAVCPYELQLELANFADAVICDYNYVFDPAARLARFFGETAGKGKTILLIDEAHNLAERGREMFSASLQKESFLAMRKLLKNENGSAAQTDEISDEKTDKKLLRALDRALSRCNRVLLTYRKECREDPEAFDAYGSRVSGRGEIQELAAPLMTLAGTLEEILKEQPEGVDEQLRTFYFEINAFLRTYDLLDEKYIIYTEDRRDAFTLKLFCVDPSRNLQAVLDRAAAAVFFSATLLPMQYYEGMLTERSDSYRVAIPSPFDPSRRHLAVGADVSTRYRMRGPELYQKIAAYIRQTARVRKGNYMVYFPSYKMLEDVRAVWEETKNEMQDKDIIVLAQQPGMTEADRDDFLAEFRQEDVCEEGGACRKTRIGFCVMGGIFAEGIDLAGDQLIGAIVVGTGLPQVAGEKELLRRYYDRNGKDGFAYAYRFPGLNKVLQAAGRVIRTPEDTGVILLLDDRFWSRDYFPYYPREWSDMRQTTLQQISGGIRDFWTGLNAEEQSPLPQARKAADGGIL
ncbi:MAG: ATP-dependent DNA helicase [Eubacterium sp.]|nr:ATP-dependent DNA helicase [Eubacterium sp.]